MFCTHCNSEKLIETIVPIKKDGILFQGKGFVCRACGCRVTTPEAQQHNDETLERIKKAIS